MNGQEDHTLQCEQIDENEVIDNGLIFQDQNGIIYYDNDPDCE